MLINKTSFSNTNNNLNKLSFKSKLTFDIGASDPRGSLKILVQNNKGKDLFEYNGFVNDSTKGFESNEDFIKKIANAIDVETLISKDIKLIKLQIKDSSISVETIEKLKSRLSSLQEQQRILEKRSQAEKKLTGFALLLPGTLQGQTALFLPNLKRKEESDSSKLVRLTEVDLGQVINEVKSQGKVKVADDIKFVPAKDLAGTGLGVAKKIFEHPDYQNKFNKGFFAAVVQTGGGFGAVDVKLMDDSKINIETNECGHDIYLNILNGKKQRLGDMGASTKNIIRNFAEKLNITDKSDVKSLVLTGLGQLATEQEIRLNNVKDEDAIKILTNSGIYNIMKKDSQGTVLRVLPERLKEFNEASKYAIHSYANAIAAYAITRINRGANLFVLSGPLAMGLNDTIKNNSEKFEAENLKELILKYIDLNDELDETRINLAKYNKFEIVCDRALSVTNNTLGGSLFLSEKIKTFSRRGEWMQVPLKVFKSIVKSR